MTEAPKKPTTPESGDRRKSLAFGGIDSIGGGIVIPQHLLSGLSAEVAQEFIRLLRELNENHARQMAVLKKQYETDEGTGLPRKAHADEILQSLIDKRDNLLRAESFDFAVPPCTVVFCDVSAFRTCNEAIGHDEADKLIYMLGNYLKKSFRIEKNGNGIVLEGNNIQDNVARYGGGDEFVLFLEGVDAETAKRRMQQFNDRLRKINWAFPSEKKCATNMSLSYGCYELDSERMENMPSGDCHFTAAQGIKDDVESAIKKANKKMRLQKDDAKKEPGYAPIFSLGQEPPENSVNVEAAYSKFKESQKNSGRGGAQESNTAHSR